MVKLLGNFKEIFWSKTTICEGLGEFLEEESNCQ